MADPISLDVNRAERLDTQKNKPTGSDKLGKDEFMKLLITQLKNQDPLSPADSQAFVAQLAQFSTLEMMQNSNSTLERLVVEQSSAHKTELAGLVGKEVLYRSERVTLKNGQADPVVARLSEDAATVTAVVTDGNGKVVRTQQLGQQTSGAFEVTWDGRDDNGAPSDPGTYSILITAADVNGNALTVDQRGRGRVTGVSLEKNPPELMLGDERIKLTDIVEINERSTQ